MGFKGVYRSLMELFPQVDPRILKAVAIEHPKSADSAAEVVISEVLPYLSRQAVDDRPLHEDYSSSGVASGSAEHQEHFNSLGCHQVGGGEAIGTSTELRSVTSEDAYKTVDAVRNSDSAHQENALNSATELSSNRTVDSNQLQGNMESEELILLMRPQHEEDSFLCGISQTSKVTSNALSCNEISDPCQVSATTETQVPDSFGKFEDGNNKVEHEHTSQVISTSLEPDSGDYDGSLTGHHSGWKEFDGPSSDELDKYLGGKIPETGICSDGVVVEVKNSVYQDIPNANEGDLKSEFSGTSLDCSKNSKFSQDIKIDVLEGIVEAAKNHKKMLFLEMESIMNKMREVELQEKIAEQAKEEAASAGEVYGEKSILVTEMRELQARLLFLSDERDKALAILDEMHQTLDERLTAAEEVKKAAEKQKLAKEESAQNAVAEQEAITEKVVQESKILQQEAEENAKLREFLMDRGRVVDTLQGEISVICHDVRLLKEKFDERVPLSKSISSSQTSCILASSGSSLKSMASDMVLEARESYMSLNKERSPSSLINDQSPKRSPASSIDGRSPNSRKEKSVVSEEKGERTNFEDDDWEFFD